MAYIRLTGFSHNGYTKLHYDYFGSYSGKNKAKPHTTKYGYNKRNLDQFGINCRAGNFNETVKDFEKFKPKHAKNDTINLVMGFKNNDEINCHRASDRIMAIRYCIRFLHKAFGPNVQALISLQHDSREPHVHITINNCNIKTLHVIPGSNRNIYRLHAINKAMIKDHNKKYPSHPFIIATSPNYHSESDSLNNSIRKKFIQALKMPRNDSKRAIRKYMKDKYKITVRFIRPNKRKSKRHREKHKHYGIALIPKGKPRIKASVIGIKYNSVIHQLYINRSRQRSIRHAKAKSRMASSASVSNAVSQYASQRTALYHSESVDMDLDGDYLPFDWNEEDSLDSSARDTLGKSLANSILSSVSSAVNTVSTASSFVSQDKHEAQEYIKERKIKHEKKIKQAKQRRFDRQFRRYNRQARRQQQQFNRSNRIIKESKQDITNGSSLIERFTHKVSSRLSKIFRSAVSEIKEVIQNHKQKKLRREAQKDRGGLD